MHIELNASAAKPHTMPRNRGVHVHPASSHAASHPPHRQTFELGTVSGATGCPGEVSDTGRGATGCLGVGMQYQLLNAASFTVSGATGSPGGGATGSPTLLRIAYSSSPSASHSNSPAPCICRNGKSPIGSTSLPRCCHAGDNHRRLSRKKILK